MKDVYWSALIGWLNDTEQAAADHQEEEIGVVHNIANGFAGCKRASEAKWVHFLVEFLFRKYEKEYPDEDWQRHKHVSATTPVVLWLTKGFDAGALTANDVRELNANSSVFHHRLTKILRLQNQPWTEITNIPPREGGKKSVRDLTYGFSVIELDDLGIGDRVED